MSTQKRREKLLGKINPAKRQFVGRLLRTTVFAVPVVVSYTMDNLTVANALPSNGSNPV